MQDTDYDHAALRAASEAGVALCTLVAIEGSFSRRLGAQLAVLPDGTTVGSLSDGCLERQLAADVRGTAVPVVRRYGRGSPMIDFRLPCGGGLDVLLDPRPDVRSCRTVVAELDARRPAALGLPDNAMMKHRHYIPRLVLRAFGDDPELAMLGRLAESAGVAFERYDRSSLSLGRTPDLPIADQWTATILLFHDHEWETAILRHALAGPAFFVGAQGGLNARRGRITQLANEGLSDSQLDRIRGPVGVIPACRTPHALALSILTEIVGEYERLHPHA